MKGPDAKPSVGKSPCDPHPDAGQACRSLPPVARWQPSGEAPHPSTEPLVCPASGMAGAGFALQGVNNTARVLREVGYAPKNEKMRSR